MTHLHKIWYRHYATGGQQNATFFNILHPVIKAVAYVQTCQGSDTGPTHFRILKLYITPNLHQKILGICRM